MRGRRSPDLAFSGGRAANSVSVIGIAGKVHLRWLVVLVDDNVDALTSFDLLEDRFTGSVVGPVRLDGAEEIHGLGVVKGSHCSKIRSWADPRHIENGARAVGA